MKKVKIVLWVIFAIVALFVFNAIRTYNFMQSYGMNLKDMKSQYRPVFPDYDDNNFPEFGKNFVCSDPNKCEDFLPESKLFDSELQEKFYKKVKALKIENFDEFKSKLVPSVLDFMKKEKKNIYPTAEETENYPNLPTLQTVRNTVNYWIDMGFLYGKKGDYNTSLLIYHGIFYLSRELVTSFARSGEFIIKMQSGNYNKYASTAILLWASRPHPECQELSKSVAKDILKLVEADYPLSRNLEYNKSKVDNIIKHFSKKTSLVGEGAINTSYYKDEIDLYINEPLKLDAKPFKEVRKDYFSYANKIKAANSPSGFVKYIPYFCLSPQRVIVHYIVFNCQHYPTITSLKLSIEESLGYMEFAAIALLINSYYCQKGNLPQSMDELEKWFGQKLPGNRFDYEPYVIDKKGKHLLTFKHVDKSYESSDLELNFDFSMK